MSLDNPKNNMPDLDKKLHDDFKRLDELETKEAKNTSRYTNKKKKHQDGDELDGLDPLQISEIVEDGMITGHNKI